MAAEPQTMNAIIHRMRDTGLRLSEDIGAPERLRDFKAEAAVVSKNDGSPFHVPRVSITRHVFQRWACVSKDRHHAGLA
ncbi:MAG: hypothetical protein ACK58L_05770 [Planctomycetota bacterium]